MTSAYADQTGWRLQALLLGATLASVAALPGYAQTANPWTTAGGAAANTYAGDASPSVARYPGVAGAANDGPYAPADLDARLSSGGSTRAATTPSSAPVYPGGAVYAPMGPAASVPRSPFSNTASFPPAPANIGANTQANARANAQASNQTVPAYAAPASAYAPAAPFTPPAPYAPGPSFVTASPYPLGTPAPMQVAPGQPNVSRQATGAAPAAGAGAPATSLPQMAPVAVSPVPGTLMPYAVPTANGTIGVLPVAPFTAISPTGVPITGYGAGWPYVGTTGVPSWGTTGAASPYYGTGATSPYYGTGVPSPYYGTGAASPYYGTGATPGWPGGFGTGWPSGTGTTGTGWPGGLGTGWPGGLGTGWPTTGYSPFGFM